MIYSTDRILTTHAGSLPRPDDVRKMVLAKARGEAIDQAALDTRLRASVAEVVKRQIECGLDIVNDGELSKPNFTDYVLARIAGCEKRPGTGRRRLDIIARDERKFAGYFAAHPLGLLPRPNAAGMHRRIALCRAERATEGHRQL
jgi:5-methyltetrahydropteroyltriglutamate--homocysteine methyltransferase